jgi:hypothetical protein
MPLSLWVPFADCKSENESNYPALVATARRLGVRFRQCETPWAAYFATTEQDGEDFPVEPIVVPNRPRTPRNELLEYVALLGLAQAGMFVTAPARDASQPPAAVSTARAASGEVASASDGTTPSTLVDDIEVGSPAWEAMNQRRVELIDLKVRVGYENMAPDYREEYDRLQYISQKAVERAFPSPLRGDPDIRRLKEILASESGVDNG